MSLKSKLNRLKGHMDLETGASPILKKTDPSLDIPHLEKWSMISAKPYSFEGNHIFIREREYPLDYQHGVYRFKELYDVVDEWNRVEHSHPLSTKERKVEDLLFFDTETTGLSHGVGNTIFLLGCCMAQKEKLIVRQFFMPEPEAEVAFYQAFLQDTNNLKNLVTYNGKAFDWPQVKTRHTLIRDAVPKLPAFGHYDLLHGARRLWKNSLESCRLSLVEEHILGIKRQDDIPGYLAPMLYFDFLAEKDPDTIKGVLFHNEGDMLSLVTLYIHLSKMLLNQKLETWTARELFELGRWYEAVGEVVMATSFFQRALEKEPNLTLEVHIKMALAAAWKRQGETQYAVDLWKSIEDIPSIGQSVVCIELSKICEHQDKDFGLALHYALKAFNSWKTQQRLAARKGAVREKEALMKRIERLELKCK